MSDRCLSRFGRLPRNATAFNELDDVIFSKRSVLKDRGEDIADRANSLTGRSEGEIVVAVPLGLTSGISDQFEYSIGRGT